MSKLKSPLLSLGAKGTVADTLTIQRRKDYHFAREKPMPANPRSLPQMYQRWSYEDYAHLWTLQSLATRQEYATAGVRHHLTGFQYWMKYQLTLRPDIVAEWRLDRRSGALALDSGPHNIHGTIFGASPAKGTIDRARSFDGTNDWVDCTSSLTLDVNFPVSFELFITMHRNTGAADYDHIFGKYTASPWLFVQYPNGRDLRFIFTIAGFTDTLDYGWLSLDTPTHIVGQYNGSDVEAWKDGTFVTSKPKTGDLRSWPTGKCTMAATSTPGGWAKVTLDNVIIRSRSMDETEIKRHSLRRYPL